jgi:hypothetical protein
VSKLAHSEPMLATDTMLQACAAIHVHPIRRQAQHLLWWYALIPLWSSCIQLAVAGHQLSQRSAALHHNPPPPKTPFNGVD